MSANGIDGIVSESKERGGDGGAVCDGCVQYVGSERVAAGVVQAEGENDGGGWMWHIGAAGNECV
jgi:hypothetical protein